MSEAHFYTETSAICEHIRQHISQQGYRLMKSNQPETIVFCDRSNREHLACLMDFNPARLDTRFVHTIILLQDHLLKNRDATAWLVSLNFPDQADAMYVYRDRQTELGNPRLRQIGYHRFCQLFTKPQ